MKPDKILLARPNTFIVEGMKRLVKEINCIPIPLENLEALQLTNPGEVAGIVISTAVSSVVGEGYVDVLKRIVERFPGKPVFLATLMELDAAKRTIASQLKNGHLAFNLWSIEEALLNRKIDPKEDLIIIRKADLTDPLLFKHCQQVFQKLTGMHTNHRLSS